MTSKITSRFQILSRGLRRERGVMNRGEKAYSEHLEADASVYRWWFEPLSLRLSHPELGRGAGFSPDFLVLYESGETCLDDVKAGFGNDYAAGVRIKAAAELFPLWKFRLVTPIAKKLGGGFQIVEV